jgi:hypothetical protein
MKVAKLHAILSISIFEHMTVQVEKIRRNERKTQMSKYPNRD